MTVRKFRVVLHGHDPAAGFDIEGPRVGFYTTRYLEADSEAEAAQKAIAMVLGEDRLAAHVKAEWFGQPVVGAETVEEIASFDSPGAGYTFYSDRSEPAG